MTPVDERILCALLRYRYLEALHVCRLFYSPGSLNAVRDRMKQLYDRGLVTRRPFARNFPQKGTYVYLLTRKGLNLLAERGETMPPRYHGGEMRTVSNTHLDHTLDINHVLIALERFAAAVPHVAVARVLPEHELRKASVTVQIPAGGARTLVTAAVIPDAWFDLRIGEPESGYQHCIALEVDRGDEYRGGEYQKRWRAKVRALVAWWNAGAYAAMFGAEAPLLIAVLATAGEKRHANLLQWTEAELTEGGVRVLGELFRFSWGDPAEIPYEDLFCAARWFQPFVRQAVPLLADVAG